VGELRDAEVRGEGGLTAFFAYDSDADVCGLDHAYIVAAIAYAGDAFAGIGTDEKCDVGFLGWRAPTGDDGRETDGEGDESVAVVGEVEGKRLAINQEASVGLRVEERQSIESNFLSTKVGDGVNVLSSSDELR